MYRSVLLDLDGTLLDTSVGVIKAVGKTMDDLGFPRPEQAILKTFVGPPMQDSFKKYYDISEENALNAASHFRAVYKSLSLYEAHMYPGVLPFLESLKERGIKIAVATSKSHNNAISILDKFGILKYLDYAMGSDMEQSLTKSDIMSICMKKLRVVKEDTVMVGDMDADLKGAQDVGIDFIAVTYGFGFRNTDDLKAMPCKAFNNICDVGEYILAH